MKRFYCDSDIGGCLIGNKDWTFVVPNIGGDGRTKISIFNEDEAEFGKYVKENNLIFISSAQGTFNIYSYDCAFQDYCKEEDVVASLSGRYQVYRGKKEVVFCEIKSW